MGKKVLIACEYSGVVRNAFRIRGHDAWSCDIIPSDDDSCYHIQSDVREILGKKYDWDMVIAHPPCTYLANSGSRWLYSQDETDMIENLRAETRWKQMGEGAEFFKVFMGSAPKVAIENPTIHRHAKKIIGRGPDQKIQPWQFGHLESKGICLWLENLPKLQPTCNVYEEMMKLPSKERNRVWWMGSGKGKERSRFFEGVAEAMAEQWG